MESEVEEMRRKFRLVCRECGSDDVVIDIEKGTNYGGETGYDPGHITIGCNNCKKNDFYMSI